MKRKDTIEDLDQKAVAVHYTFAKEETFDEGAKGLLHTVKFVQRKVPNAPRWLYLGIDGHRNENGGFDHDAYELQKYFIPNFLMQYLTGAYTPLGSVESIVFENVNQLNDIPDELFVYTNEGV